MIRRARQVLAATLAVLALIAFTPPAEAQFRAEAGSTVIHDVGTEVLALGYTKRLGVSRNTVDYRIDYRGRFDHHRAGRQSSRVQASVALQYEYLSWIRPSIGVCYASSTSELLGSYLCADLGLTVDFAGAWSVAFRHQSNGGLALPNAGENSGRFTYSLGSDQSGAGEWLLEAWARFRER